MKLLKEIRDSDVVGDDSFFEGSYNVRNSSRALVFNKLNQIAIIFVLKNNYHKIPGGGVEDGENLIEALEREVMEEIGGKISVDKEVGVILEYRNKFEQLQISYCYTANLVGDLGDTNFTKKEKNSGFQVKWMNLEDAIKTLEKDEPNNYAGKYMSKRDLIFLREGFIS